MDGESLDFPACGDEGAARLTRRSPGFHATGLCLVASVKCIIGRTSEVTRRDMNANFGSVKVGGAKMPFTVIFVTTSRLHCQNSVSQCSMGK
jgi:hypothetical protein